MTSESSFPHLLLHCYSLHPPGTAVPTLIADDLFGLFLTTTEMKCVLVFKRQTATGPGSVFNEHCRGSEAHDTVQAGMEYKLPYPRRAPFTPQVFAKIFLEAESVCEERNSSRSFLWPVYQRLKFR